DVGLSVPHDIAVIAFDNIFAGTLISPSLSTVNVPAYQMGTHAMKRVLERISGEVTGNQAPIALKTQTIIRRSTDINCTDVWDLHGW
ncbi:MAG: substrate-binding domain-containing protein, partial [Christensenellaceae bacterium]